MAGLIGRLTFIGRAATLMLACLVPSHADVSAAPPPMDAIPLIQGRLDRPPPDDAFQYRVLQSQFDVLGFKDAARKLDTYQKWRLLSEAVSSPVKEASTLRDVITQPDVKDALLSVIGRMATDQITVTFPAGAAADDIPGPQLAPGGREHVERLGRGVWGAFEGRTQTSLAAPEAADAFYLAATVQSRLTASADIFLEYDWPKGRTLGCKASDVVGAGTGPGLCEIRLFSSIENKGGSRWMPLAPAQKLAVYEGLLGLRQTGTSVPKAMVIHVPALHLTVDTQTGVGKVVFDNTWLGAAETEARMELRSASCEALGTCSRHLDEQLSSRSFAYAVLTLVVMACLVFFRFRRGAGPGIWPLALKLYVVVFVLAVAVNVIDRPTGTTRGAPMSGSLGFLAKVAVSMPWSYYLVVDAPPTRMPAVLARKPMADDSPWLWTFAWINLAFLTLMAIGRRPREQAGRS